MIQKITVTGFIYHDSKVLILRRQKEASFMPGVWELPGGKLEFGENPAKAIVREVKEETNLDVYVDKIYNIYSHVWQKPADGSGEWKKITDPSEFNKHSIHSLLIEYLLRLTNSDFTINLNPEHDDHKWITPLEQNNHKLTEEMKEAISKGFKEIN